MALAASIIAVAGLLLLWTLEESRGGDSVADLRAVGFIALALGPVLLFAAARRLISNTRIQAHAYRHGLPAD